MIRVMTVVIMLLTISCSSTPKPQDPALEPGSKMLRNTYDDCIDTVLRTEREYLKKKFDPLYAMKFDSENPVYIYGYYNGHDLIQLSVNPDDDEVKVLKPRTNNIWHENSMIESKYKFICFQNGVKYYGMETLFRIGTI